MYSKHQDTILFVVGGGLGIYKGCEPDEWPDESSNSASGQDQGLRQGWIIGNTAVDPDPNQASFVPWCADRLQA